MITLALPTFDKPVKLLIVVAPWFKDVTEALVTGAKTRAAAAEIDVLEVPSPSEIPTAIAMAQRLAEFHGYVALGCAIRGETSLFDTQTLGLAHAFTMLGLSGACLGTGILTVDTLDQARLRADPKGADKGGAAAAAALHLIAISRKWAGQTKGIGFRA